MISFSNDDNNNHKNALITMKLKRKISNQSIIINVFNKYFANININLASNINKYNKCTLNNFFKLYRNLHSIVSRPADDVEIVNYINKSKNKNSTCRNNNSNSIIKVYYQLLTITNQAYHK